MEKCHPWESLNPHYTTVNVLLQIKIAIFDTTCQRLVTCALRYRPPPGCATLRYRLMEAMGHDQAVPPCRHSHFLSYTATEACRFTPRRKQVWAWERKEGHQHSIGRAPVITGGRAPGHSLSEVVVGRWEACYCQTICASFDVWYHVWVNLSLQQGHQPGPTRSKIQLGFLSCRPGRTGLTTADSTTITRPEHCFMSETRELIRSKKKPSKLFQINHK